MATGYYLQDHPNPTTAQYGWLRAPLGEPGQHLSGVIGVHTSEAITDFEGVDNNAENNAAFIGRRADYGSYSTSADADSILPLVHPAWAVWADTTNNAHAMSVSGCLQAARWLEMSPERRRAVVVNMAAAAARMVLTAVQDGYLAAPTPARRITSAEAISGSKAGFYGHGETNPGTRYDPGAHFDWELFLSSYQAAISGTPAIGFQNDTISIIEPEDDMGHVESITDEAAATIARVMLDTAVEREGGGVNKLRWSLAAEQQRTEATISRTAETTARLILNAAIKRGGASVGGDTTPASVFAYFDQFRADILNAVGAVPGKIEGLEPDRVNEAISAGLDRALAGTKATITLGKEA